VERGKVQEMTVWKNSMRRLGQLEARMTGTTPGRRQNPLWGSAFWHKTRLGQTLHSRLGTFNPQAIVFANVGPRSCRTEGTCIFGGCLFSTLDCVDTIL
jgi:hypothetical protein